nr:MAG TPA: hypothetical protein [Caudoviricetes sp.]
MFLVKFCIKKPLRSLYITVFLLGKSKNRMNKTFSHNLTISLYHTYYYHLLSTFIFYSFLLMPNHVP